MLVIYHTEHTYVRILYHTYVLMFSGKLKEGIFGLSLNAFLELVAVSIEKYSPIVETHYG